MSELKDRFKSPGKEYQCDVRWWLAEALHTDETLIKEVNTLAEDGFGAVEFLAINELGADSSRYGWGSEEWVHDTEIIIREVTKKGMGASFTSGTNWSNANLPDTVHTPDDPSASKELDYTVETLGPGQHRSGPLLMSVPVKKSVVKKQILVAIMAAKVVGEANGRTLLESPLILTPEVVDHELDWTAPTDGEYLLLAFWMHGTGQTATPSYRENYTVNYMDRYGADKVIEYWDSVVLTPALREYIKKNNRVQMYMDSLEIAVTGKGGQLWGYHFLKEFHQRRGYDLTPYLPYILRRTQVIAMGPMDYHYEMVDPTITQKIRNDLYQTQTDLYMYNMLKPLQDWLHSHNMTLRAEISYGLPFEISQPGKCVDGIETESLEFASQIDSFRGLAGAAHIYDKVFSSETGATMMNHMCGLNFYNQIIYTQFAAGVTKTVLHGYSSICGSEKDTQWPGHEGMWPLFSERFGQRQPSYRFYQDWTASIARFQRLLRSGRPRRDVAILRLDYNYWNQVNHLGPRSGRTEKELYESVVMRNNEGIYWQDCTLQNAGYSYDYFSPNILEDPDVVCENKQIQPDGPGYQAVVIYQEDFPLGAAERLLAQARLGLPVIFANGITEAVQSNIEKTHAKAAISTPYFDGKDDKLVAVVAEMKNLPNVREINNPADIVKALKELGVSPRAGFDQPNKKVFTLLREEDRWHYLYVYHYMYTEKESFTTTVKVEGEGVPYTIDCRTGDVTPLGVFEVKDGFTRIPVTIEPGEARMFAIDKQASPGLHCIDAGGGFVDKSDSGLIFWTTKNGLHTVALSDGSSRVLDVTCRQDIPLPLWNLIVESWTEGERKEIREDRGLGYTSKEIYYETAKEKINVGQTTLIPWKDIDVVGAAVSGLGFYETSFTLPIDWSNDEGVILEFDEVPENGMLILINDMKVASFNPQKRFVDISDYVKAGENTICIEVASTLSNRLLAAGYYNESGKKSDKLLVVALGINDEILEALGIPADMEIQYLSLLNITPPVQDYGLIGEVRLKFYKRVMI